MKKITYEYAGFRYEIALAPGKDFFVATPLPGQHAAAAHAKHLRAAVEIWTEEGQPGLGDDDLPDFLPSPYQQAFFDWVVSGSGSAILVAGPGSGKTKTIERTLPLIAEGASVQCFAFNSDIGKELDRRVQALKVEFSRTFAWVRAGTFHSVGYAAVCKKLGSWPKPNRNKLRDICRSGLSGDENALYGDFIAKLVSLAKGQGVGALVPDVEEVWWEIISHHDLVLDSEEADEVYAVELARDLLRISNENARHGEIDFDDQLYLPILWKLRLWQNDWVFVDEAQDTNPVRRAIAKLALRPGGRLVAVGDPRQAIYGFTGASADAMDLIRREFSAVEMPLTVCYRCDAAVVEAVNEVYPGCIEVAPGAKRGERAGLISIDDALKVLAATDAILCRNVAPIVALAYDLIARGRGCRILGRNIGEGLIKLIDGMRARTIDSLEEKLSKWEAREVAKHTAKGEEAKAESVADRAICVRTIVENLLERERTIAGLKTKIASIFSDGASTLLTLSTIHGSKGKEYPRVAIYRPELMPSKWARQDHQLAQERNLDWVARSRARNWIGWISDATLAKRTKLEGEALGEAKAEIKAIAKARDVLAAAGRK